MKNLILLTARADIHDHISSLWRTDVFRDSHASGGFVHEIADRFARLPRFFSDMSDEKTERAHFTVWWSGVSNRTYEKPSCSDLYLLHELAHGACMTHIGGQPFAHFRRRMEDNELHASVLSEVMAYFALPSLRALTFGGEIFADRFLGDPLCRKMWLHDRERLVTELYYRRRKAMFSPADGDPVEQWMHGFTAQNEAWYGIWMKNFDRVEAAMERFTRESLSGSRKDALKRHVDWLTSDEAGCEDGIPFRAEARAFAGLYWKNRAASAAEKAA